MNLLHHFYGNFSKHSSRHIEWLARGGLSNRRVSQTTGVVKPRAKIQPLRLGFVPLTDAAPLIVAQELGFFARYGLAVTLSRELGWASVRDKVVHRELDAAHALAPMPFANSLGLGVPMCDCLTALVLNQHGNGITLSNALSRAGVRDGQTLRAYFQQQQRGSPLVFGVVSQYSSHHFLLHAWLARAGFQKKDVSIVVVPPPQMTANLKAGHLDGFCAGEPWNSVAVQSRAGWCTAVSAELAAGHPEKVLIVRSDFAQSRHEEHLQLVAALIDACEFCDEPEHNEEVIALLARPEYVDVPPASLRRALPGPFDFGHGEVRSVPDFLIFHRDNANEPGLEKAAWVLKHLRELRPDCTWPGSAQTFGRQIFRSDLFAEALRLRSTKQPTYERKYEIESCTAGT